MLKTITSLTRQEELFLYEEALCLAGLPKELISQLISISKVVSFPKDTIVTRMGEDMKSFMLILSGLIRVNVCSSSGKQITFLLVKEGEPYNMLSPFSPNPRILEATAMQDTRCLWIEGAEFKSFVETHPPLAVQMISGISQSLDNANNRILDLLDKSVEERVRRVLNTLHRKFGSPLLFTSVDIADLAGTTPESALRVMAILRDQKIIQTQRGKIWITDPGALVLAGAGDYLD